MKNAQDITITQVEYHRNGVGGEPFHVITFRDHEEGADFVGVVFDYTEAEKAERASGCFINPRTAVFRTDLLGQNIIEFGINSWRGDRYDSVLRKAVEDHTAALIAKWNIPVVEVTHG